MLVSVGIPTFNRAHLLQRAVESVLSQTLPSLELVISDNASTDGTAAYCADVAGADDRVVILRLGTNAGATANFKSALDAASGDTFMWLADDDWLDPDYLHRCVQRLHSAPDLVVVVGQEHLHTPSGEIVEKPLIDLCSDRPYERVRDYYRTVQQNTMFYGLAPIDVWRAASRDMPDAIGVDWLVAARAAYAGKVVTERSVRLHRSAGGASMNVRDLAAQIEGRRLATWTPYSVIAFRVAHDLITHSQYGDLPRHTRLRLAATCLRSIVWRKVLPLDAAKLILPPRVYARVRDAYRGWRT